MAVRRLARSISRPLRGLRLACVGAALAAPAAHALTPTPTAPLCPAETPTPIFTPSGTPTPFGIFAAIAPNPARGGQVVTLDASGNGNQYAYQWAQVGDGPALQIDDADRPIAHFVAPAVAEITFVSVRVTASPGVGLSTTYGITLLPADAVTAQISNTSGVPGTKVGVEVRLHPNGLLVTGVVHEIDFDAYAPVADRGSGIPDCEPNGALDVSSAGFGFVPQGCSATNSCTGVQALITTREPIPEGAVAYDCLIALSTAPTPPGTSCSHTVQCVPGFATSAAGLPLAILCPEGADGTATANYLVGEPQFAFAADPPAPVIGDTVHVTFTVLGDGGLPLYTLHGADPLFVGPVSSSPGGELGSVTFDLTARCPGTAYLYLDVDYETLAGCPGNTYFQFTDRVSQIFPITVRDPSAPGPSPSATSTATVTPTPSAMPSDTCLPVPCPSGLVPYCMNCPPDCEAVCVTPTPATAPCAGDCNGDGRVTIDELVRGVNLALASGAADAQCPALDANGDGGVSIDEIIAAVHAALQGCAGDDSWTAIGPRSTAVGALAIDPTDPQTIYAATASGVSKTVDAGRHWAPTGFSAIARSIAIDPETPSTVYATGTDGVTAVFGKSTDGGESWQPAGGGLGPGGAGWLAINPRQTSILYGANSRDVYRSTDGAETWTPLGLRGQSIESFSYSAAHPARIYVGRYRDGLSVVGLEDDSPVGAVRSAGVTFCGGFSGGAGDIICAVAAAPSRSEVAYANEIGGYACKTTDGGATWNTIAAIACPSPDVDPDCRQTVGVDPGCAPLAVDPTDPDILYAASNSVLGSTDGGATFHRVGRGLPADLGVYAIALDPASRDVIYVGTDDGVYRLRRGR